MYERKFSVLLVSKDGAFFGISLTEQQQKESSRAPSPCTNTNWL